MFTRYIKSYSFMPKDIIPKSLLNELEYMYDLSISVLYVASKCFSRINDSNLSYNSLVSSSVKQLRTKVTYP